MKIPISCRVLHARAMRGGRGEAGRSPGSHGFPHAPRLSTLVQSAGQSPPCARATRRHTALRGVQAVLHPQTVPRTSASLPGDPRQLGASPPPPEPADWRPAQTATATAHAVAAPTARTAQPGVGRQRKRGGAGGSLPLAAAGALPGPRCSQIARMI